MGRVLKYFKLSCTKFVDLGGVYIKKSYSNYLRILTLMKVNPINISRNYLSCHEKSTKTECIAHYNYRYAPTHRCMYVCMRNED